LRSAVSAVFEHDTADVAVYCYLGHEQPRSAPSAFDGPRATSTSSGRLRGVSRAAPRLERIGARRRVAARHVRVDQGG
jgi:hypothetical protein